MRKASGIKTMHFRCYSLVDDIIAIVGLDADSHPLVPRSIVQSIFGEYYVERSLALIDYWTSRNTNIKKRH